MARYCITIVLLAVIPRFIAAKRQDLPFEKLKLPSQITVTGRMLCSKLPAYAVLINIVEKIKDPVGKKYQVNCESVVLVSLVVMVRLKLMGRDLSQPISYKGSSGQEMSGKLRISRFSITGRDGAFKINGTRFVSADKLYLNITHHCIPLAKRKEYMVCY
ncbi:unnamed protein product [Gongylonema pulchrum]|uniref:Transthyretin-like family protein n=1 Tax=Gongylonema pulchrum TaxID=637853 RepID=A0A183E162_9BILA|nr:unnamed protein product [Gongylonema pulchrum]